MEEARSPLCYCNGTSSITFRVALSCGDQKVLDFTEISGWWDRTNKTLRQSI